jgi:ATP adenylyltransferase
MSGIAATAPAFKRMPFARLIPPYTGRMNRLWTPWRYDYVTGVASGAAATPNTDAAPNAAHLRARPGVPEALAAWPGDLGCVFCNMIASVDFAVANGMARDEAEAAAFILERSPTGFLVLNAFPYNSGHLMAVPYLHQDSLAALPLEVAVDLLQLTRRGERVLRAVYRPDGLNLGMNLGRSAGAGVADHLHMHAVPRWDGDNNYMSVLAETRILPEMLEQSWHKLRGALAADAREATLENTLGVSGSAQRSLGT